MEHKPKSRQRQVPTWQAEEHCALAAAQLLQGDRLGLAGPLLQHQQGLVHGQAVALLDAFGLLEVKDTCRGERQSTLSIMIMLNITR
jgi:hypothetical protein